MIPAGSEETSRTRIGDQEVAAVARSSQQPAAHVDPAIRNPALRLDRGLRECNPGTGGSDTAKKTGVNVPPDFQNAACKPEMQRRG